MLSSIGQSVFFTFDTAVSSKYAVPIIYIYGSDRYNVMPQIPYLHISHEPKQKNAETCGL